MRRGIGYGWLSTRRRLRHLGLPALTTATGAFLVVLVFGMSAGIRAQSAMLGHAEQIGRAVVLIAVTVLLVGVAEVAVATTRTIAHRTAELGVLAASGVPRPPIVAALLVEPVAVALAGACAGAALAGLAGLALAVLGVSATGVSVGGMAFGALTAVAVSVVAALIASVVPTWKAASRPPIGSLSAGA